MGTERWSLLFWIGLAIAIGIGSVRLDLGELHNPGPGFLSFLSAVILGGLGLIVFVTSKPFSPEETEKKPMFVKGRAMRVVLTLVALMCYGVAMEYIGFLIGTMLFLIVLFRVIEPQRWPIAIVGSLLGSVVTYLVFEVWLRCELPKGFLVDISKNVFQSIM